MDQRTFMRLWAKVERPLFKKAKLLSREPEDLLQETALACWKYRHTFRMGTKFIAWTTAVLKRLAIRQRPLVADPGLTSEYSRRVQAGIIEFDDPGIVSAMNRLKIKSRIVLMLRDIGGMTAEEAAEELGYSKSYVTFLLRKARHEMRLMLGPQFDSLNTKGSVALQ